ncbi:MAG: TetR/AcrR family transcriptional regulator [Promethearchaeota archaeon]|jgi:AcrR family transcriptional regulator
MKKGTAKEKIIQIAKQMFQSLGYSNTYVNEIASKASVSIGTLYYHFPQGKLSILKEMGKMPVTDYSERLKEKGYSLDLDYDTISDALKALIAALIKLHFDERDFILALEVEFLSKLDEYLEIRDTLISKEEINAQAEIFVKPFQDLINKFPEEGLSLIGKKKQIQKLVDILIHRHTYVNDTFGTEEEFVKMMTTIILALLKN